jgi:hypothetical protein
MQHGYVGTWGRNIHIHELIISGDPWGSFLFLGLRPLWFDRAPYQRKAILVAKIELVMIFLYRERPDAEV